MTLNSQDKLVYLYQPFPFMIIFIYHDNGTALQRYYRVPTKL